MESLTPDKKATLKRDHLSHKTTLFLSCRVGELTQRPIMAPLCCDFWLAKDQGSSVFVGLLDVFDAVVESV